MKNSISLFIILVFTFFICDAQKTKKDINTETDGNWSIKDAKDQAKNFNDSTKWEMEILNKEIDLSNKYPRADFPLFNSPFPTPTYESPGNGHGLIKTEIGGKKIIGHNVIIGNGKYSEHLFKHPSDKFVTYFTILVIADGQGTENPVDASSRNHPNYFSQGSLNTSTTSRVDWIALQLADKNAYAIINSRVFDLRVGRLILAAPQKDGSIRFYQTDAPPMNSEERKEYIENLKTDKTAIEFYENEFNIQ